jgi:salicylate hydroxylase
LAATRHVLISGAGIAGLTASLALAKAGLRSTVIEQAPRLEDAGAGIQLSPNATRILIALGLEERLKITAVEPQAIRVMSGNSGREIVRVPLGRHAERRYGAPYWIIHRADLQTVLADAARANPDINLHLATRIEDYAAHKNGVSVLARRGGQMVEEQALALIGADGLWSSLRDKVRRQGEPKFRHKTAWRALVPAHEVGAPWRQPVIHLWLGLDSHLVSYPVKGGALINIVGIVDDEWREPGWSATGEREEILRHFARWSWAESARELIASTDRWQKWALFDGKKPFRAGSGPVALIGDASHPALPFLAQGGAMAIEDAAVLAAALGADPDNPAKALRVYERTRRSRVGKVQKAARRQGKIYGMVGPEAFIRNIIMKMRGGEKLLARYDWLYSWRPPEFEFAQKNIVQLGGEDT